MTSDLRPPRLARAIAAWALPAEMREVVIGDLDEEFAAQIAHGHSRRAAAEQFGHLDDHTIRKLARGNAIALFGLDLAP